MILADTSVWIDHLRSGQSELHRLLGAGQIVIHPFIIAEIALGPLRDRSTTLALLDMLPKVRLAHLSEVRHLIEVRALHSSGIGLIDAHLVASVLLERPTELWTRDKRLRTVAESLRIHVHLA